MVIKLHGLLTKKEMMGKCVWGAFKCWINKTSCETILKCRIYTKLQSKNKTSEVIFIYV